MINMDDPVITICVLALLGCAIVGIIVFAGGTTHILHNTYEAPNKMAFKSFVAFYELNPDKWELFDNCVIYKTEDKDFIDEWKKQVEKGWIDPRIYPAPTKTYGFSFNYRDFRKYRRFRKHVFEMQEIEKQRKKDKHNYEQYQEALEYLKQDLKEFKKSKPWEDIKL